jgi:hypothetical protein
MKLYTHPPQLENSLKKYNLNKLQISAFKSFTQINSIKQILQYVRGVARTKKTQIIKAIQDFFMKTKNEQKLRIVAYNANAALLVGGTTIHSLLGLSIDKHAIVSKFSSIINIWLIIDFTIIDEISMVNCNMLDGMHLKLQK